MSTSSPDPQFGMLRSDPPAPSGVGNDYEISHNCYPIANVLTISLEAIPLYLVLDLLPEDMVLNILVESTTANRAAIASIESGIDLPVPGFSLLRVNFDFLFFGEVGLFCKFNLKNNTIYEIPSGRTTGGHLRCICS